jgi:ribonuclease E
VRQLRLRDIGGIIVIDFIDMVLENNRDLVLRRLIECLGRDRTRHQVAEVTSLGLVQMTRKRIGTGLLEAFSEPCEHCQGRGLHLHAEPVESRRSPSSDEESQRGRRGRGRGRSGDSSGNGGQQKDGRDNGGESAKENGNGAVRRPTPAEFAAMVRSDQAKTAAEAEPEADGVLAEQVDGVNGVDQVVVEVAEPAEQPAAEQPAEPEPVAPPVPAGPRLVTSVRRTRASRPAGPPPSRTEVPASGGGADGADPSDLGEELEPTGQPHVPVKKKGTRKR